MIRGSANGQDKFVLERVGKNGVFVDCGAHNGIHCSDTLLLEENGWNGLCIEADIDNYNVLKNP